MLTFVLPAAAQTLVITNGVQTFVGLTNTSVTMSNRCELRLTSTSGPLSGCVVNLNSQDAYVVFPGIKPSAVALSYLSQLRVNGAAAVADSNCRVVQYAMGTIVVPHASSLQPLTVYSGPHFTGTAMSLSQYVYYKTTLGALYANISSFKLKRGYMAVMAQTENGTGISKSYVAQDGDMEVSVLPDEFDDSIRFVYVTPWRWTSKKSIAGNPGTSLLNVQSWYNWNLDQNSTRDLEYVPIRQQRYWPGLGQNWQTRGANTLLGYNEPDHTDQANIVVGDAISSWPDLLATGLRVGSPAPSDGGYSSWLYPFMSQADAANLRVDFVVVHYYRCFNPSDPNGAATQMYNALKGIYDTTKRPLWITEWNNGANWTTCGDPSYAQQQAAVAAMINMLDNTPFVERYALYNWVEDVRALVTNNVLTSAGVSYRDQQSPIGYVQALQANGTRGITQFQFETNTLDSSGFGNNGLAAGSPAYTNGHSGRAIVFDGSNTVVTLPPNVGTNSAFSFAAWVNWSGGANWQRLFDFGNDTTHTFFLTPSSGNGTLRFAINNGSGEQRVETSVLPQNSWQHVAFTLSGSTGRLYVNGVQAAQNTSMSISPASFAPRVNRLGKSQTLADPLFKGAMDDVLITDYALTAAQIAALMTNTPPQFTSNFYARGTGTEGLSYSNSIAGSATDVNPGDTLTYSKAGGAAWLKVAANGTLTGTPTSADGGTNYFTVAVTDAAGQSGFALITVVVTVLTSSGTWIADANANWGESNRWSGNLVATGMGQTADFSTINISGNRTVTLDTTRTIATNKFGDTSGSQSWTLTNSGSARLILNTGSANSPAIIVNQNSATLATPVGGTNGFTKSGTGTLILSGNNSLSGTVNIDSGSTTANDGTTRLVGPGALGNASLLQIRNNNSGSSTLQLDGSTGSITVNADVSVTCRNNGVVTIENVAGTNIFNGDILLNVGGNSHTVQSDANSLIVFTGTNMYVGSLMGSRTYFFTGAGNHLLIGPVLNSTNGAPIALSKSGTGTLVLAAVNTYTNGTTLSGGTLIVDGSLPAGAFAISSGATLAGIGTIKAAVTLPSGATIAPGDNTGLVLTNSSNGGLVTNNNPAIGVLTVNSNVTLQAGSVCLLEIDKGSAMTNDQLRVTGTLTSGGTLSVVNLGGNFAAGDSFKLFNATTKSGFFAATNLPPLTAGLAWNYDGPSGVLSIVEKFATSPTNLNYSVSGDTLSLSWPVTHTGWRLQAQTNDLETGLGTNWFDVLNSSLTNQMSFPINPTNGGVFYRMLLQ